ncbi:hypothetical protein FACS18945_1250 [Bacteroidia bacterium]|nr:hypothetical protein FACS18945_1250 [Bacteroidia bacterium]
MRIYDKFIAFLAKIANQKSIFILTGIASTLWFLLRVIPKPQRATYPCMRAAAPLMSAFVCYIFSFLGILGSFKLLKLNLKKAKYVPALACVGVFVLALVVFNVQDARDTLAVTLTVYTNDSDLTQEPTSAGTPKGITGAEGRVAWVWDTRSNNAANINEKLEWGTKKPYWDKDVNDQYVIDRMFSAGIMNVANQTDGNIVDAWDKVFKYFNTNRASKNFPNDNYTSGVGYQAGEKIFIKVNYTSQSDNGNYAYQAINSAKKNNEQSNLVESNPFTLVALLRNLVEYVGVAQGDIYIGDPIRSWPAADAEYVKARYPDVHLIGVAGTAGTATIEGRVNGTGKVFHHNSVKIIDTDTDDANQLTKDGNKIIAENINGQLQNAKYVFNLPVLKAHESGGISALAKSFFGCHTQATAGHYHWTIFDNSWHSANYNDNAQYHKYRIFVDLMASRYLGQKVVLNIVDALYSGVGWDGRNVKWAMAPFNGNYPSSVFMSLDPVALESVCLDFLRGEYTQTTSVWGASSAASSANRNWKEAFPYYPGIDDHLHQLADPNYRPVATEFISGTGGNYNPDGDKVFDYSLGVHAHWNRATKTYPANTIDLVKIKSNSIPESTYTWTDEDALVNIPSTSTVIEVKETATAPTIDGTVDDVWNNTEWQKMDFRYLKGGAYTDVYSATFKELEQNPTNYAGMYKYLYNSTAKELYVLAKIKDNNFITASSFVSNYYEAYDILEVFFAPQATGGTGYKCDDALATRGYAQHITVGNAVGGVYPVNQAIDVPSTGATDWGIGNDKFVKEGKVKKIGDYYYWELKLNISDIPDAKFTSNGNVKFSMAYNDIDYNNGISGAVSRTGQYGSVFNPDNSSGQSNAPYYNIAHMGTIKLSAAEVDTPPTPPTLPTCEGKLPDTQRTICATRSGNSISLSLNNSEDYFELIKVTKKGITTVHYEKDVTAALNNIAFTNGDLPVTVEICTNKYKLIKKFW